ncbi:hypothetical protein DCC79_12670 [bacterium]|nr:MAG: hypothetical protein DCC79_12670 [bacterium]
MATSNPVRPCRNHVGRAAITTTAIHQARPPKACFMVSAANTAPSTVISADVARKATTDLPNKATVGTCR